MVVKSYGKMRGTRRKLRKKHVTVTRFIKTYEIGDRVRIDIASQKKMPHPKFHSLPGKIIGRHGKSYIIEIKDRNATKKIYTKPEHIVKW
jgi:large subunit ribosomal protein L21e